MADIRHLRFHSLGNRVGVYYMAYGGFGKLFDRSLSEYKVTVNFIK